MIKNENVLLLVGEGDPTFQEVEFEKMSVTPEKVYISIKRILIRVLRNLGILGAYLSLGKWKYQLKKYDTIVCFAADVNLNVLKCVERLFRGKRMIYYLYGRIGDNVDLEKNEELMKNVREYGYEIWSYDLKDCDKYGFRYNKSFYTKKTHELISGKQDTEVKFDIVFIANNKGRGKLIQNVKKQLESKGLRTYFYVLNMPDLENNKCINNEPLPYEKYIEIVKNSKAVLDLVIKENYGLTLRPIEALLAEKKLITNYLDIKKCDFYNENNIYVLEDLNLYGIERFFDIQYEKIDSAIITSYGEEAWIQRFMEK